MAQDMHAYTVCLNCGMFENCEVEYMHIPPWMQQNRYKYTHMGPINDSLM